MSSPTNKNDNATNLEELKNVDPSKYSGLQLPTFVLQCLASGMSQEQIALKFPGDGELVRLWVSFLRGNHRLTKGKDGRWSITSKGHTWIEKYGRRGQRT
jgi:hypothetical protein